MNGLPFKTYSNSQNDPSSNDPPCGSFFPRAPNLPAIKTQPSIEILEITGTKREIVEVESPAKKRPPQKPKTSLKGLVQQSPQTEYSIKDLPTINTRIIIYPSGTQAKDQVTLTKSDQDCLNEGQMLNDNIVYFYLKYLTLEKLDNNVSDRLHLFNTFFYPKLKQMKLNTQLNDIRRWYKDVDVFSKDFLVIPVCDHIHWILLIVCYPGNVTGPNDPITIHDDPETMNPETDDPKLPAIIIFDSLGRRGNYRLTQPVREFLKRESMESKKISKDFARPAVKDVWAKVPKQLNSFDCGVFILKFFEEFFKEPVKNYVKMYQGRDMSTWFQQVAIIQKRADIRALIGQKRQELVQSVTNRKSTP